MAIASQIRGGKPSPASSGTGDVQATKPSSARNAQRDYPVMTWRGFAMGVLVSMGGLIFGYDTGQISGFLEISDFKRRFSSKGQFSAIRQGLIVGFLSIGTLIGALVAAPFANRVGRRLSISGWCVVFALGLVVQIASEYAWYQVMIGRLVAGIGVGALSILVPLFQSETAPSHIRGGVVCAYQLFITLGILIAYIINYGTERISNSASWRITIGIGFLWALVLGFGILLFPETPKHEFRNGHEDSARRTMIKVLGVPENHPKVHKELRDMKEALEAEQASGSRPWWEIFTGPRMAYRTLLGVVLQAFQQLTGANFFFYYGTTIFVATGLSNSFVTQIILGAVNVGCTFPGLWFVDRFGRRICMIIGGIWMCKFGPCHFIDITDGPVMCFMVFASVGHFVLDQNTPQNTPTAGTVMIVFACLFIAAYASTWGPMVWTVTGEMFPSRYRAQCMSLSTASNWIWNFLIAFFTQLITESIDFRYGYVFAACCLAASITVYFSLLETQGRTLEEIDMMYVLGVRPWNSAKYIPESREDLVNANHLERTLSGQYVGKERGSTSDSVRQQHAAQ